MWLMLYVYMYIMRYHGGKSRLGKKIAEIVIEIIETDELEIVGYIEPFCGMCGVLTHVIQGSDLLQYLASDCNESVIKMWNALGKGWEPEITLFDEKRFDLLKGNGESSAEKGFFGHATTFGALYFQNFRPILLKLLEFSKNDIIKRSSYMKDVIFTHSDYKAISNYNVKNNVIYCDPPYEIRSRYYDEYNKQLSFDSDEFWDFCVALSSNNVVVVSETYSFLEERSKSYIGTKKIVKLPNRKNRFGSSWNHSGEYVCILTRLFLQV